MAVSNMVKIAAKITAKSTHKQYNHAAIILKGGKIISAESNTDTMHAEVMSINRAWKSKLNGTTMVVVRIRRDNGGLGMSKPCNKCLKKIKDSGIKKVIYSVNGGVATLLVGKAEVTNSRY
jgi:deoxycytidylate deaminase